MIDDISNGAMLNQKIHWVLQNKAHNSASDLAKVQIKSEPITPLGGIFLLPLLHFKLRDPDSLMICAEWRN